MQSGNFHCRQLGFELPVIQAPMAGGGDTPELIAAVCNGGGIGYLGAAYLTPEQILERTHAIRKLTTKAFGINLFAPSATHSPSVEQISRARRRFAPFYDELGLKVPTDMSVPATSFEDQFDACLEAAPHSFSFTFGRLPSPYLKQLKNRNIIVLGTATTVGEALILEKDGVDAIIAQGSEAGGHRGTFATPFEAGLIGLFSLLPQVSDAVRVPVIASGGVMDGRGIVAAIALGATAVQMGTAFLVCHESGAPECYKQAIHRTTEDNIQITRAFSGRPARGILNKVLIAAREWEEDLLPFPQQNVLTRPMRTRAAENGLSEYLSLWCGQSPRLARPMSAAELVKLLSQEISQCANHIQTFAVR